MTAPPGPTEKDTMSTTLPLRRTHSIRLLMALAASAALLAFGAAPAAGAADDLDQIIDRDQPQGSGQVVLSAGHADLAPLLLDEEWVLRINDDTDVPRSWRDPEDVVFAVSNAALLTVPDDDAFSFLNMPPGTDVHVVPQVEQPGVVWLGWNTQAPTALENLRLGATLRVHDIAGPGDVVTYLQGGNFAAPQTLFSTAEAFPQEAWIEINTHTHANWVFSEPGVYLIDAEFTGDLTTGEEMSARGTLRFAVGDATDPAEAFAATVPERDAPTDASEAPGISEDAAGGAEAGSDGGEGDASRVLWYVVGAGALALVVAVTATSLSKASRRRARRAAEREDATS